MITIILAESEEELQKSLLVFQEYCDYWKLSVNIEKTKVMVFTKKRGNRNYDFRINGSSIDEVDSYTYLGLLFNYNGKFTLAKKQLVGQAEKALYALYKKIRNISIPVDLQLKLFDALIEPILLYSCEVWGFENVTIIEKIHLKFLKRIMGVRSSTPNFMVYGETGRYPLEINIKIRLLNFWSKLLVNNNKLSGILYQLLYKMHSLELCKSEWINYIKSILDYTGLSYVWNS